MHNEAVLEVDETNSVSTSPKKETHDESIWGVDATNSVTTRRIEVLFTSIRSGKSTRRTRDERIDESKDQFSLGSDFIIIRLAVSSRIVAIYSSSDYIVRQTIYTLLFNCIYHDEQ